MFHAAQTLVKINQEKYSSYDYGRGVLQRTLLPLNTFEEQGRRNMSNNLKSHQGFSGRCLSQRGFERWTARASQGSRYLSSRSWAAESSELSRERQPRGRTRAGGWQQGSSLSKSDPGVQSLGRWEGKRKEMGKAAVCFQSDLCSRMDSSSLGDGDQNRLARTHSSWN